LCEDSPDRVRDLERLGVRFDADRHGALALGLEGGHSRRRVVHAGGAATGAEVERALVEAARATAAALLEGWLALDLLVEAVPGGGRRCRGVVAVDAEGGCREVRAAHVLAATGGAGQLFAVTTNPSHATGDGVAMALRAGVAVADLEFFQFHPTALHHPSMPRPLLSEALRGHGALLRDTHGRRFVDELQPRDVVSRAMTARMAEQGVDHLWLDATGLEHFDQRFPTIAASLRGSGLDPGSEWLPIAPAAHYVCGGIVTDLDGASSLPGLWACGEVACTGVHGANRLASNSLLEGMVFAPRVVEAIGRGKEGPEPSGAMRDVLRPSSAPARPLLSGVLPRPFPPAPASSSGPTARLALQRALTEGAGVLRSAHSLEQAGKVVEGLAAEADPEVANLVDVGRALVAAALAREESRGAHFRSDFPETVDAFGHRLVLR
jgi:L-aspartate oxidase